MSTLRCYIKHSCIWLPVVISFIVATQWCNPDYFGGVDWEPNQQINTFTDAKIDQIRFFKRNKNSQKMYIYMSVTIARNLSEENET